MDNLKSLFEKKEYELIIKLTEKSTDADNFFFRMSAFTALNKIKEAIATIESNRKVMETHLIPLMNAHIELLCLSNDLKKANEEITYYASLPYVNQETEEAIKMLPEIINKYTMSKLRMAEDIDEDKLKIDLKSKDEQTVLSALDALRDMNLKGYLIHLQSIMLNFPKQQIRTFALLLLVHNAIDAEFKFNSLDTIMKVNPSHLKPPFVGEKFESFVKKMETTYKDPSITRTGIDLLSSYILLTYPNDFSFEELYIEVFYRISVAYLDVEDKRTDIFENEKLIVEETNKIIKILSKNL